MCCKDDISHLESLDHGEAVEENYDVSKLLANPTVTRMKNHKERKIEKAKARNYLFLLCQKFIFTRIMNLKSVKDLGLSQKRMLWV